MYSRSGQKSRDELQDIRITLCGVVESGGVDENDPSFIESERVPKLDLGRTRIQVLPNP